ncbi:hypothetical protein [Staphylococcus nepalensis]|uniref:hypothetical protein n=1 Tax=Staphylococcus nepalensis TaxID=214473 RepID=UPI0031BA7CA4
MMNDEEFDYVHINTGDKKLSIEEIEEVKDYLKSNQFKDMVKKSKENHDKVMESKITDRTKM